MAHEHATYELDTFVGVKCLASSPKLVFLDQPAIHDVTQNANQEINLCYNDEQETALAIDDNLLQQALHQYQT